MNSPRAPYSRRGLRLFLGAQASLYACFDRLVFWLIVTTFLLTTSPTLFAQTNDNAATAGGRVAEQARTPALPSNATVTLGLRLDNHSIFSSAVSPKAGLNLRVMDFWRIRASYSRGFRAPDLGQLFYRFLNPTNFYQVIGNPNLRTECAHSVRVGGEFTSRNRRAHWSQFLPQRHRRPD